MWRVVIPFSRACSVTALLTASLALVLVASPHTGTRLVRSATTDPEILLDMRRAAFNAGDIDAVPALFAEDAVLISGTRRAVYTGKRRDQESD